MSRTVPIKHARANVVDIKDLHGRNTGADRLVVRAFSLNGNTVYELELITDLEAVQLARGILESVELRHTRARNRQTAKAVKQP
jgi:hypothetical protein